MYIKDLQNPKKGNGRTETNRRMIWAWNKEEEELIKHKEISPHNWLLQEQHRCARIGEGGGGVKKGLHYFGIRQCDLSVCNLQRIKRRISWGIKRNKVKFNVMTVRHVQINSTSTKKTIAVSSCVIFVSLIHTIFLRSTNHWLTLCIFFSDPLMTLWSVDECTFCLSACVCV